MRACFDRLVAAVFVIAFSISSPKPAVAGALELALGEQDLTVTGLTPGASVVIFEVARVPVEFAGRITSSRTLYEDSDGDGVVSESLEEAVPWRSIWAAVDAATGDVALATPQDYPLRVLDANRHDLGAMLDGGKGGGLILGPGEYYELLVVRPGGGSWGATVYDGNPDDLDGEMTMAVAAAPDAFQSLTAEEEAPKELQEGDRIVGIDPNEMTVYTVVVPGFDGGVIQ
jgi:hypothetical protein